MRPLAGKDAQALDLLMQAAAIGRHRKSFTVADLIRVAHEHLDPAHLCDRRLAAERRRADQAEAEVARLEHELAKATSTAPAGDVVHHATRAHRTVLLTPLQADIVQRACRGATASDIARATGHTASAITNHLYRAALAMDADHTQHGVFLVQRGVVEVRVKKGKRAA